MSCVVIALARLKADEGFRSDIYVDTTGHRTIGYGFNIDAGITQFAAEALMMAQISELAGVLSEYWWAKGLDDVRMSVLIELAFNNGIAGLLHYVKMLAAIGAKNWPAAHDELLDSDAAGKLPGRYQSLATLLLG